MIEISWIEEDVTITLNRPQKANSLTQEMLEQLIEGCHVAQGARSVVFTGAGTVFSAGADLDQARAGLATSPLWEDLSSAVAALRGLSIAAINGTVAGGAFGMVLACDLRISVPDARFFYPVMKHGFLPQPSDPKRMANLIGPSRTKLVFLAGHKLSAETALDYGLVDRLVPLDGLMAQVEILRSDVNSAALETVFGIKAMCPTGRI
jgi:enoyl-CoA hydratase/carnithine racemase